MSTDEITAVFTTEKQSDSEVWILEDGNFADQIERRVGEDTDEMMYRANEYVAYLNRFWNVTE